MNFRIQTQKISRVYRLQEYITVTILIEKKSTALFSAFVVFLLPPATHPKKSRGTVQSNCCSMASHCIRNQELRDRNAWASKQPKYVWTLVELVYTYPYYTYYSIIFATCYSMCTWWSASNKKNTQCNTSIASACDFLATFSKHVQYININLNLFICLEEDVNLRKCDLMFVSYHLDPLEPLGLKPMGLERCFTTTTPGSPTLLNTAHVVVDEVLHRDEINCDFQDFDFYIILDSILVRALYLTSLNTFMSWASCNFCLSYQKHYSFFRKPSV